MRRLQSHAFSEKALSAQETVIQGYVSQLIRGLSQQAEASKTGLVSIGSWFNFATFDIIGDLAFAESFDCLEKGVMNAVTTPSLSHASSIFQRRASRPMLHLPWFILPLQNMVLIRCSGFRPFSNLLGR
jgi:hypothetical protein